VSEEEKENIRILVLAANPLGTVRLHLDEEVKAIREAIQRSAKRDRLFVQTREAATLRDLHLALLEFQPHVVHFSGHGSGKDGLQFVGDIEEIYWQEKQQVDGSWEATGCRQEKIQAVDAATIADLLALFANQIECVVLNACDSNRQGAAIARHIPHVVSMRTAICDRAARKFSQAFYDSLGAGKDYEFAFELGKTAIQAEISDSADLIAIFKTGNSAKLPQRQSLRAGEQAENAATSSWRPTVQTLRSKASLYLALSLSLVLGLGSGWAGVQGINRQKRPQSEPGSPGIAHSGVEPGRGSGQPGDALSDPQQPTSSTRDQLVAQPSVTQIMDGSCNVQNRGSSNTISVQCQ